MRWVYVHDLTGGSATRDEYFFTTDVGTGARRWSRPTWAAGTKKPPSKKCAHLGLETTRGLDRKRCLRPCLFGAYTVVALYSRCPAVRLCGWTMGGEAGRDVLRRHHGRKALAVGGMGFCNPRLPGGL